jgi:hypothetical protein
MRTEHIDKLDITSDLTGFTITPRVSGTDNQRVQVAVSKPGGGEATARSGPPGAPLRVPVLNPRLWTPDDPYLYDIKVRLVGPLGKVVDEVSSYAGAVGTVVTPGAGRVEQQDLPSFRPLDQDWPDGIYTAPTDDALRFDSSRPRRWG